MTTPPPVSPDYARIAQHLRELADEGKRPSVPYCQTLLENIESTAILLQEAQKRLDAIEPLLLEVVAHLRQQAYFSKSTRLSMIHRAERALKYDHTHDSEAAR